MKHKASISKKLIKIRAEINDLKNEKTGVPVVGQQKRI